MTFVETRIQKNSIKAIIWAGIFSLILASVIIAIILFFYSRTSSHDMLGVSLKENMNVFLACEAIDDSSARYDCYQNIALSSLKNGLSTEELSEFASSFSHNKPHFMAHAIGRAALIISGYNLNVARDICWPDCISGYFHGLSEGWSKYAPSRVNEYMDFLSGFCNSEGALDGAACSPHNAGHFYMTASNALVGGISLCDNSKANDIFYRCSLGVIHQYIIDEGKRDIFDECLNLDGRKKLACYGHGSFLYTRRVNQNIEEKIERCGIISQKIPTDFNYCYDGIGEALRNAGKTPDLTWCETADASLKKMCIRGLTAPERFGEGSTSCDAGEASENGSLGCEL